MNPIGLLYSVYSAPDNVDDDPSLVHLFGIRNAISSRPMHVAVRNNIDQVDPCLLSSCSSPPFAFIITIVRSPQAGIMAGATFVFAWLACAALFVLQVQAGWEMLMPGDMPKGVAKRQGAPSSNGPRTVIDAGFGTFRIEHLTSQGPCRLT